METVDIAIVGAGQAGLAAAHATRRAGLRPVVLEASDSAGGSWPHYYDSLRLFTPARFCALPGRPFPGDGDRYPVRDEVADYLSNYAKALDVDLRYGHRVTAATPEREGGFTVAADTGTELRAARVIAASGAFGRPHRPALPGLDGFTGRVLHSAEYRAPDDFAGQRIIVVGGKNSAVQIAVELARVATVTLASLRPLQWIKPVLLGRDIHWWFVRSGIDSSRLAGRALRRIGEAVNDGGGYSAAFAEGLLDRRPMFARLDGDTAEWSDGAREHVDTVLLATGYRPELGYLHGTGALDLSGTPLHREGVSTAVPGLGYVGLEFQRAFRSATLRGVGPDAWHVVGRLLRRAEG